MKILFCDIDGTLTETISGQPFKQHPRDVKIINGADKAIAHFNKLDWLIIGVSNQGGIAAGKKSLEDTIAEMNYTLKLFPEIYSIIFCPDFEGNYAYRCHRNMYHSVAEKYPDLQGKYRKPGDGMIQLALIESENDPDECLMTGDRPEDEECALNAGIKFIEAQAWRYTYGK